MKGTESWAVVCGTHVNAYSITAALREIGWEGRIVCIKQSGEGPALMDFCRPRVEVWDFPCRVPRDVVALLSEKIPPADPKFVLFTDECFHEAFRTELMHPRLENARFSIGSEKYLETILDRYAFYQFIEQRRICEVPRTISAKADPWKTFHKRFFFRFRRSWKGLDRLNRVRLIASRKQFDREIRACEQAGHQPADWCYQEVLSTSPQHNLSISGWHDAQRRTYVATRHLLRHPGKSGNGDVTEIVEAPPGLEDTAGKLLDALEYQGPFELEHVFDLKTRTYKVIELNPRFWMQHGLIGAATGHEVIRRCLELPSENRTPRHRPLYWINSVYAAFRILRGDLRVLRYLFSPGAVFAPSWNVTLRWLPRQTFNTLRRCLPG